MTFKGIGPQACLVTIAIFFLISMGYLIATKKDPHYADDANNACVHHRGVARWDHITHEVDGVCVDGHAFSISY